MLIFDADNVEYEDGIKPIYETDDKCEGIEEMWKRSIETGDEFVAVLTNDNAILIIQQLDTHGGGFNGMYEFDNKTYYQYPVSLGSPVRSYSGQIISSSRYFIPIKATIHTHAPCLRDGTDGITGRQIDDDKIFGSKYPCSNHYIIGCGKIGQFNGLSNSAFNIESGLLSDTCNKIN